MIIPGWYFIPLKTFKLTEMKNAILIVAGIILIILIFSLLKKLNLKNKELKIVYEYSTKLTDINKLVEVENTSLLHAQTQQFRIDGYTIPSGIKIFDDDGVPQNVATMFSGGSRLVFYFTEFSCDQCVEEQVKILNEFEEEVLVIVQTRTNKDLFFIKKNKDIRVPVFYVPSGLDLGVEELELPVHVVVAPSLKVESVFIPVRGKGYLTKEFLKQNLRKKSPLDI